jgi:hypothetical protein
LAATLALAAIGCGARNWPMNEQVEGTVKMDGAPLPNVMVQFVPDLDPKRQAPQSAGMTDENGHFTLTCDNKKPGAVLGKHNVVVIAGRGSSGRTNDMDDVPAKDALKAKKSIPLDYAMTTKTPLKIEVTADKHSYELTVSTGPR